MLNDNVKWWYCLVNLILLVPEYVGASFFIVWFGKDSVSTRGKLACGCIMFIVSASLLAAWCIIYFIWIYEGDTVYFGWGTTEEGYIKYAKKYYVFRELAFAVVVIALYCYFICVVNNYADALKEKRTRKGKEQYLKEQRSRKRAEEDLDKAAKDEKYISLDYQLKKKNYMNKKKDEREAEDKAKYEDKSEKKGSDKDAKSDKDDKAGAEK